VGSPDDRERAGLLAFSPAASVCFLPLVARHHSLCVSCCGWAIGAARCTVILSLVENLPFRPRQLPVLYRRSPVTAFELCLAWEVRGLSLGQCLGLMM